MRRSEVLAAEAVSCLNKALMVLKDVWEQIGISEEQRLERTNTVKKHIQGLLEMMIAEEKSLKSRLEKSVEETHREIQRLSRDLDLPQTQTQVGPRPLLQVEKDLKVVLQRLQKEAELREQQLRVLLQQEQQLATILGTRPFNIDPAHTPSARQLDQLQQHLTNQRELKVKREEQFRTLRDQILVLFLDLDHSPDTDLERDLVHSDVDQFCLSLHNLDTLDLLRTQLAGRRADLEDQSRLIQDQVQTLWDRLNVPQNQRDAFTHNLPSDKVQQRVQQLLAEAQRLQLLKESSLRTMCDGVRAEISQFWDKCFCSEEQRLGLTVFYSDQVSERVLEVLEAELQRLKRFYEEHRPILEGIQRWMDQWELFLELERKASDPSRFTNRGGNLLREERQRAELSKSLPKLERLLQAQVSQWEQSQKSPFFVKGLDFLQFVEQQWNLLHQQKEQEKNLRLLKKARQTEEDMMYGTTVRTPTKRRFISTNSPTRNQNQTKNNQNRTRRTPLSGCSLSTNSSVRSATGPSPGPRPPQVPLVRTPVQAKPPQPRVPAPNQDQTRTKPGLNHNLVWTQEQKENRPEAPPESQTLGSVASTYSDFLRDMSESNGHVQNQVLNSTDL